MFKTNKKVMLLLVLVFLCGCGMFGEKARRTNLLPALRNAAIGLKDDARAGVEQFPLELSKLMAQEHIDDFFDALATDPVDHTVLLKWYNVMSIIDNGIRSRRGAGEIGPNVALSLSKRMREFDSALRLYLERLKNE